MWHAIAAAIAAATGKPFTVERRTAVTGGCINRAFRIEGGGATYFVKVNAANACEMFAAEAAALEEISRGATVRVPRVVCHGASPTQSWLVTEYIALSPTGDFRMLGRRLAAMHRVTSRHFGWWRDNTIGATPQVNSPAARWPDFWREQRLGFQLRRAAERGYGGALQRKGEKLLAKLDLILAHHAPPASLLHGDLWSGNMAFDAEGMPVIFDPATYYGDREVDLALTELFGRLPQAFYTAYREAYPVDEGYALRKDLYNLYHVLNHLNLFGAGYLRQAESLMVRLLDRA
jgi:fructosamine-3-kinase